MRLSTYITNLVITKKLNDDLALQHKILYYKNEHLSLQNKDNCAEQNNLLIFKIKKQTISDLHVAIKVCVHVNLENDVLFKGL